MEVQAAEAEPHQESAEVPPPYVPNAFAPGDGEAAVLSLIAFRDGSVWRLAAGSLLTLSICQARTSWKRWSEVQPEVREHGDRPDGFDLGPNFVADPFPGVRIARSIVTASEWPVIVEALKRGEITLPSGRVEATITESTSTVFLGRESIDPAHRVVAGARRPVHGVVCTLDRPAVPPMDGIWQLATPPHLWPGPDLGRIAPHRSMANWAEPLVGVAWPPGHRPGFPDRFVIGRVNSVAWIARMRPDTDSDLIAVRIAWDEQKVDPLSCSLLARVERDGLPLRVRHLRISDFPGSGGHTEPRLLPWGERTLDVTLPRGPREAWGVSLLGPAGELLDESTVAVRVESIHVTFRAGPAPAATTEMVIGDRSPPAAEAERDEAVRVASESEAEAKKAAARRRLSTTGELEDWLRWRFSCRHGELLILDPHLFSHHGRELEVAAFLAGFDRPVRALVRGTHQEVRKALAAVENVEVTALPGGGKALHDRIWIVGETAVLVGASPGDFLAHPAGNPGRATTATDMPHADALEWRARFERWWKDGRPDLKRS